MMQDHGRLSSVQCGMALFLLLFVALPLTAATSDPSPQIDLKLNATEAEAVLRVVAKTTGGQPVTEGDWRKIFSSEPYMRLREREASMHRELTDDGFRSFVLSGATVARAAELGRTLDAWKGADLDAAARRILPYLPSSARIQATVYPVIKPQSNSFVFEAATRPAIFLYVDPAKSREEFENTIAHELHHIGLASLDSAYEARIRSLPDNARAAATWMGAFGEGLAVLAAAGSAEVHPMAAFPPDDRVQWDQDMKYVDQAIGQLTSSSSTSSPVASANPRSQTTSRLPSSGTAVPGTPWATGWGRSSRSDSAAPSCWSAWRIRGCC